MISIMKFDISRICNIWSVSSIDYPPKLVFLMMMYLQSANNMIPLLQAEWLHFYEDRSGGVGMDVMYCLTVVCWAWVDWDNVYDDHKHSFPNRFMLTTHHAKPAITEGFHIGLRRHRYVAIIQYSFLKYFLWYEIDVSFNRWYNNTTKHRCWHCNTL